MSNEPVLTANYVLEFLVVFYRFFWTLPYSRRLPWASKTSSSPKSAACASTWVAVADHHDLHVRRIEIFARRLQQIRWRQRTKFSARYVLEIIVRQFR